MNVAMVFAYVTPGGFKEFEHFYDPGNLDPEILKYEYSKRGRAVAFQPGKHIAKLLSNHSVVIKVGDTVFVHGGLSPQYARMGISELNQRMRNWMNGTVKVMPTIANFKDGPVWNRDYSWGDHDAGSDTCKRLDETLNLLGAKFMVVGHTQQHGGINSTCGGKVWRADVGMAAHYGGRPQVLEIKNGNFTVIK